MADATERVAGRFETDRLKDSIQNLSRRLASKVTPEVRAKAFTRWDTNKNDRLSLEEYQAGLKGEENLEARFKKFDQNSDGKLTREEFIGTAAK